VLDFIIRKTYGWHKISDRIALSQFEEGTGLKKTTVCKAINKLSSMNLIVTQKGNELITSYCFNKHYKAWKPLPKKVTLPKKVIGITQKGKKALPKKVHTKETITKETITKERSLLSLFKKIEEKFNETELSHKQDFIDYWTEKSDGGKNERWEFQKTFDVNLRFHKWLRNISTFNKPKKSTLDETLEITKNLWSEDGLDPDMEVKETTQ